MKKAIVKTATIIIAFITSFAPAFSQATASYINNSDSPVEVKFIGLIKQNPLFTLNMNNTQSEEFLITLKNGEGVTLYTEKLKGINLTRKYKIDILDDLTLDAFNIRFEILNLTTNNTQTYSVRSETRQQENFFIARL